MVNQFYLPIEFDLGAIFLFALTGAWVAIRRNYDFIGVFTLALATGVGGGLIRDSILIQQGAPAFMQDARYIWAVLAATVFGALTLSLARRFDRLVAAVDALGLGAYAVVGVEKALAAGLSPTASILVGVVNATGGGLIRDLLVRDEPLLLKPGQYYALAALAGCIMFLVLLQYWQLQVQYAAWSTIAAIFVFRMLAIQFNWRTAPMQDWGRRRLPRDEDKK
ncbi:MAG TPA: trimeric intracellular cation channel family protein [Burkholderiales bacterium]|nr:trimeric intracellular cation channel family protein [Burkholderiales bacterium]